MNQEQQNADNIAKNTGDIAQNTSDIQAYLENLNEGGQDRWRHIYASEEQIAVNDQRVTLLDAINIKIRRVQFKINTLAAFVLLGLLVMAGLLQLQASNTRAALDQQCADSQVSAQIVNRNADLIQPGLTHVPVPRCHR